MSRKQIEAAMAEVRQRGLDRAVECPIPRVNAFSAPVLSIIRVQSACYHRNRPIKQLRARRVLSPRNSLRRDCLDASRVFLKGAPTSRICTTLPFRGRDREKHKTAKNGYPCRLIRFNSLHTELGRHPALRQIGHRIRFSSSPIACGVLTPRRVLLRNGLQFVPC